MAKESRGPGGGYGQDVVNTQNACKQHAHNLNSTCFVWLQLFLKITQLESLLKAENIFLIIFFTCSYSSSVFFNFE